MNQYEKLMPLVWFFKLHPLWFTEICKSQKYLDDTVSLSTELWEDICEFIAYRRPIN